MIELKSATTPGVTSTAREWANGLRIYGVYIPSFQDSNNDGFGDLQGVIRRLGYIRDRGNNAISLSPIHKSPMVDGLYDQSGDDIDPKLGDWRDYEELIREANAHDLKVSYDFVAAHTSDKHPDFIQSRSSRSNPLRNRYVWADPGKDNGYPNNWQSQWGGSIWKYDSRTGQFYKHNHNVHMPDLNLYDAETLQAQIERVKRQVEMGVDMIRVDAIDHMAYDLSLPDVALLQDTSGAERSYDMFDNMGVLYNHPYVYDTIVPEICRAVGENVLVVGESYLPTARKIANLQTLQRHGVHNFTTFHYGLLNKRWTKENVAQQVQEIADVTAASDIAPIVLFDSHDEPRFTQVNGLEVIRAQKVLQHVLPGGIYEHYGAEIGIYGDLPPNIRMDRYPYKNRVSGRTPMQWDGNRPYADFTEVEPWLPLLDGDITNVAKQLNDPSSVLAFVQSLNATREKLSILAEGNVTPPQVVDDVVIFSREHGSGNVHVLVNFGKSNTPIDISDATEVINSDAEPTVIDKNQLLLRPNQTVAIVTL